MVRRRTQAGGHHLDPRRVRTRGHLLRHGRSLRPFHQRGGRGRGACAVSRSGRDRHQVRLQERQSSANGLDSRPERIRKVADASLKRLQHRPHRPLLSAPRRSERADGGCRRNGQGADRGRQGQAFRPVGSGVQIDPPRACGAAGGGAPERIFAVVARARKGNPARCCEELGIGFVPFSPLGKGFLTGAIDEKTSFDDTTSANIVAALLRGEPQGQPGAGRGAWRNRRREDRSTPRSDRSRLAPRAKAVDRADPWHDKAASARRKPRRSAMSS